MVAQAVDAAARKHQQAVLHDVHLNQRKTRAGKKGHDVHGEIEGWIIGNESANLERVVAHEGRCGNVALAAGEARWRGDAGQGQVRLFNDRGPRGVFRGNGCGVLCGKIGITAARQAGAVDLHFPFEHIHESLLRSGRERPSRFELRRILREPCAYRRRGVNDGGRLMHSRQRRADKRIGSLQNMVGAMSAASLS